MIWHSKEKNKAIYGIV